MHLPSLEPKYTLKVFYFILLKQNSCQKGVFWCLKMVEIVLDLRHTNAEGFWETPTNSLAVWVNWR